jgi:hypothetical protein
VDQLEYLSCKYPTLRASLRHLTVEMITGFSCQGPEFHFPNLHTLTITLQKPLLALWVDRHAAQGIINIITHCASSLINLIDVPMPVLAHLPHLPNLNRLITSDGGGYKYPVPGVRTKKYACPVYPSHPVKISPDSLAIALDRCPSLTELIDSRFGTKVTPWKRLECDKTDDKRRLAKLTHIDSQFFSAPSPDEEEEEAYRSIFDECEAIVKKAMPMLEEISNYKFKYLPTDGLTGEAFCEAYQSARPQVRRIVTSAFTHPWNRKHLSALFWDRAAGAFSSHKVLQMLKVWLLTTMGCVGLMPLRLVSRRRLNITRMCMLSSC